MPSIRDRRASRRRKLAHDARRTPELRTASAPDPEPGRGVADWDEVDEASWESFPASDPPSYGGVRR